MAPKQAHRLTIGSSDRGVASSVGKGGVDDRDQVPSLDAGETPRRSTSSLGHLNRPAKFVIGVVAAVAGIAYGISFFWPIYDWDLKVPSPDQRYDLVVLRGDAAAFADFSYRIYLFPRASTPADHAIHSRVWYTPIWRGRKYLVYSGYSYPMFRWTGPHTIEIDLNEAYWEPFALESVKRFGKTEDAILTSVVFGGENSANARP